MSEHQEHQTYYEVHVRLDTEVRGEPDEAWTRYTTSDTELAARAVADDLARIDPDRLWRIVRVDVTRLLVGSNEPTPEVVSVPPEVHLVRDGAFLHAVPLGVNYAYGSEDPAEVTCSTCKGILEGLTGGVE